MILNDYFETSCEDLELYLIQDGWGFSQLCRIKVSFKFKYVYLDQIGWNKDVGCVIGFNMSVMWIWPNLMHYGKSQMRPWVVEFSYANTRVYGSILSVYLERNIEYSIRWIMELPCAFMAK